MIDRLPSIADIMTADLLYYDEGHHDDCYRFCEERDIDCLPVIGDSSFYRRNDEIRGMEQRRLTADRRLNAHTPLFRPDLLDRFRRQHVMFIFDRGEMTGVVHFSDYNKSLVSAYLYLQIAAYEQSLRQILTRLKLEHTDMLAYFKVRIETASDTSDRDFYSRARNQFNNKAVKMPTAPKFQAADLRHLIGFVESHGLIELDDEVVELRNSIMHANRLVDMVDPNNDDYIYDFASFEVFFTRALLLLKDSRRVHNRLAIERELKADEEGRSGRLSE